jgi:hypothetical protein
MEGWHWADPAAAMVVGGVTIAVGLGSWRTAMAVAVPR